MKKLGIPPKAKAAKLPRAPKTPSAKNNVLGPLGRSEQPPSAARPNSVIGELAREQDSPLSKYIAPKKVK